MILLPAIFKKKDFQGDIFVKVIDLNFFLIGNGKKTMCQYVLYSKSMCVRYNSVCVSVLFSCKFVPEQKFKKGIIRKKKNTNKKPLQTYKN